MKQIKDYDMDNLNKLQHLCRGCHRKKHGITTENEHEQKAVLDFN